MKQASRKYDPQKKTRKNGRHLRVPVLPDEEEKIKNLAAQAGLSTASYLRNIGLGYETKSVLDLKKVDDLAKVNGDLGRLGGLLKLWLTNKEKVARFGNGVKEPDIRQLLLEIQKNQLQLRQIMQHVINTA